MVYVKGTQEKCVNSSFIVNSSQKKKRDNQIKNIKYCKIIKCYDHPSYGLRN